MILAKCGTRPKAIQARFLRSWPMISFLMTLSVSAWLAALEAFCSSASKGGGVERVMVSNGDGLDGGQGIRYSFERRVCGQGR